MCHVFLLFIVKCCILYGVLRYVESTTNFPMRTLKYMKWKMQYPKCQCCATETSALLFFVSFIKRIIILQIDIKLSQWNGNCINILRQCVHLWKHVLSVPLKKIFVWKASPLLFDLLLYLKRINRDIVVWLKVNVQNKKWKGKGVEPDTLCSVWQIPYARKGDANGQRSQMSIHPSLVRSQKGRGQYIKHAQMTCTTLVNKLCKMEMAAHRTILDDRPHF